MKKNKHSQYIVNTAYTNICVHTLLITIVYNGGGVSTLYYYATGL
jgi:hypothetical protein